MSPTKPIPPGNPLSNRVQSPTGQRRRKPQVAVLDDGGGSLDQSRPKRNTGVKQVRGAKSPSLADIHRELVAIKLTNAMADAVGGRTREFVNFLSGKRDHDSASSYAASFLDIFTRMRSWPQQRRRDLYTQISQLVADAELIPERAKPVLEALDVENLGAQIEDALASAATWDSLKSGVTSRQHFEQHFADIPVQHRPFAHVVRARARTYYDALVSLQSKNGKSIGELFPIQAGYHPRKLVSPEQVEASRARRREKNRLRMAASRAAKTADLN